MSDQKSRRNPPDIRRIYFEIQYLAHRYGLSEDQARVLMEQYGYQRAKLDAAARQLWD